MIPDRRRSGPAALLIAAVTFTCFLPTLQNEFVNWDDHIYLWNNPHYRGLGWQQVRWAFTTLHGGPYQPLSWLSYGLDYALFQLKPYGYHLTSMILHAANAALVVLVAAELLALTLPTCGRRAVTVGAVLAALLFAVHPLRVESVAWATERRDVLSGLFFLLAVLFYLRWCRRRRQSGGRGTPWPALAFVAFCLSLLSKGMGVTLPLVLLVLDWYPLRRLARPSSEAPHAWPAGEIRRALLEKIPFFVASLAIGIVAILGVARAHAISSTENLNAFERLVVSGYGMVFYVLKTLIPMRLSPLYEFPIHIDAVHWRYLGSAALFVCACAAAWRWRGRFPFLFAAGLCYVIILLPVSGLLHAGPQLTADRYTYLATISLAVLVGAGWARLWSEPAFAPQRAPLAVLAALGVAGLAALTWRQTRVWHHSVSLWEHVARLNPESWNAQNNLGVCYSKLAQDRLALEHYRRAIEINPADHRPYFNLGRLYAQLGQPEEAAAAYETALKIEPGLVEACTSLGNLRLQQGRNEQALELYHRALEYDPDSVAALTNLGETLIRLNRPDEALAHLRRAVELAPDQIEAQFNLGRALQRSGLPNEAVEQFRHCQSMGPDHLKSAEELGALLVAQGRFDQAVVALRNVARLLPDDLHALTNLGVALMDNRQYAESLEKLTLAIEKGPDNPASCLALSWLLSSAPIDELRDPERATHLALKVCEASGFGSPGALDALASAYAALGRYEDAAATAARAEQLARAAGRTTLADEIAARRAEYENGRPYRRPALQFSDPTAQPRRF